MRGINKTILSGNVSREINYGTMSDGASALSFTMASDRHANGTTVTAWVKINVYIDALVEQCRTHLACGGYVIVDGELMNRDGRHGKLTEVRAKEIVFVKDARR